jgi:hypothetical protein
MSTTKNFLPPAARVAVPQADVAGQMRALFMGMTG